MCWINYIAIPIILKKPLRVYKLGTATTSGDFMSLYHAFWYYKHRIMPTIELDPEFIRHHIPVFLSEPWMGDSFCIDEGYHSYLTEEMAKCRRDECDDIGIFEIPAGSTIYIDHIYKEVVSTNIRYLGLLKV